jgi:hypothetical protein
MVPEGVVPLEGHPTLGHKPRSSASSMAPEDPSILGLKPMDARRSMGHLFGLDPLLEWIVGPTSENVLKPTSVTQNKFPIVVS